MCVAATAKRRRRQLRQTRISRNRTQLAKTRYSEAKYGATTSKKKK